MLKNSLLLAAFAGLLTAAAMPNELFFQGNLSLGLVCLVPYFLALRRSPGSRRQDATIGAAYGIVSGFATNYWLMFFGEFSVWTIGGVTLGFGIYHAILAPILGTHRKLPPWARPVALALFFAGYDYLRSIGFLAYPWGLMGYPAAAVDILVQHADITGVWLLSFVVTLGNAVILEIVDRRLPPLPGIDFGHRRAIVAGGSVFLGLSLLIIVYGLFALREERPVAATARMVLIQQNSDSWARGNELPALAQAQELTRDAVDASREGTGVAEEATDPDLIVWSETSLRRVYTENSGFYREHPEGEPFLRFLRELPAPLLTGAPVLLDAEERRVGNGAILLSRDGEVRQWYAKNKLVPFAENIPFWHLEFVRSFFRKFVGLGGVWTPGSEYRLFELSGVTDAEGRTLRYGAPICFEDAFSYVCRDMVRAGADLLINLTNNSWSKTDSAQVQHYVAAKFRSVENRITLVRSTNSGLTTVVDPWGRRREELPMFEEGYLVVEVPIYVPKNPTFYTRHGDYLGRLFAVLSGVLLAFIVLRERRTRR
ncbi:MAG: apolipoprotein N-acyltransferase [Spirochaetota bacterium]